jgi:hypothetical protein
MNTDIGDRGTGDNNSCPVCGVQVSARDYVKLVREKPNRIRCAGCGALLRYNLNWIESTFFFSFGVVVTALLAYLLWPPVNLFYFVLLFVPPCVMLFYGGGYVEAAYVRKYRRLEVVD